MRRRDAFTPNAVQDGRTLHIEVGTFNVEPSEYIAETQAIGKRQHVAVGDGVERAFLEPERRVEPVDLRLVDLDAFGSECADLGTGGVCVGVGNKTVAGRAKAVTAR